MKRAFVLLIGAVLLTAACSSDSKTASSTSSSSTSTSSSPATSASSSGSASSASSGSAALAVAANSTIGKSILVDAKGMTVYLFVPDGANAMSQVPANIKANWPPVTATGTPAAGTGLDASKLTVQTQADGTKQLSYNGHLLYTFAGDAAAGDAKGQGLGGNWYVLTADGQKVDSD